MRTKHLLTLAFSLALMGSLPSGAGAADVDASAAEGLVKKSGCLI